MIPKGKRIPQKIGPGDPPEVKAEPKVEVKDKK